MTNFGVIRDATTGLTASVEARKQTPTGNVMNVQIGPGDVISNIPVVMDFGQHQVPGGTTATDVFNRNRNSATTPQITIVDGVTSADGTKLPYTAIAGAAEKTADGVRANDEVILKSNTTYVVRYEEITATTRLVIHFEWYEDLGV